MILPELMLLSSTLQSLNLKLAGNIISVALIDKLLNLHIAWDLKTIYCFEEIHLYG